MLQPPSGPHFWVTQNVLVSAIVCSPAGAIHGMCLVAFEFEHKVNKMPRRDPTQCGENCSFFIICHFMCKIHIKQQKQQNNHKENHKTMTTRTRTKRTIRRKKQQENEEEEEEGEEQPQQPQPPTTNKPPLTTSNDFRRGTKNN